MALTTVDQGLLGTYAQYTGFKNRIINGQMQIDQRNAGASVTPATSGTYTLDRFAANLTQASKFSVQQNAGSVTPPVGFSKYLGITVGASANVTVGAGDLFGINQGIEGFNISDLGWGTASAQAVTVSFWVRSSLTGTFGGTIANGAFNRYYPFIYTISAANTWEQKTITIAGDTSGTWTSDNTLGLQVRFSIGAGSTYSGTAGSWGATTYYSATGAVKLIETNSATFYITGVQLEKGSTATSFDYRPYGTELALCQRYYEESGSGNSSILGIGYAPSSGVSNAVFIWQFKVTKRATPTGAVVGTWSLLNCTNQPAFAGLTAQEAYIYGGVSSGAGTQYFYNTSAGNKLTANSEL